jgi:Na+/proline symporter
MTDQTRTAIVRPSDTGPAAVHGQEQSRRPLLNGAVATAVAAVFFPRLASVLHENGSFFHPDREAEVLIPVIIGLTLALFAVVGGLAWRAPGTRRIATATLVTGILGVVGVLAFFVSAPIVFGGLALTLGREAGRRQAGASLPRRAVAGFVLGSLALVGGALLWLLGS